MRASVTSGGLNRAGSRRPSKDWALTFPEPAALVSQLRASVSSGGFLSASICPRSYRAPALPASAAFVSRVRAPQPVVASALPECAAGNRAASTAQQTSAVQHTTSHRAPTLIRLMRTRVGVVGLGQGCREVVGDGVGGLISPMPSRAGSGSLCASRACEVQDRRLVAARSGSGLRASGCRPAMALSMSMSTNSASSRSHRHLFPRRGRERRPGRGGHLDNRWKLRPTRSGTGRRRRRSERI